MQSTGHSSTHALSLMSMHGSAMTYAMEVPFPGAGCIKLYPTPTPRTPLLPSSHAHRRAEIRRGPGGGHPPPPRGGGRARPRGPGEGVLVVVSALGETTDDLLDKASNITPAPEPRELDMLLTAGERIAISPPATPLHPRGPLTP